MKTFDEYLAETSTYEYRTTETPAKTGKGHTIVGHTWTGEKRDKRGANIVKHKDTDKFFASGGSTCAVTKKTVFHATPEAAAKHYHSK